MVLAVHSDAPGTMMSDNVKFDGHRRSPLILGQDKAQVFNLDPPMGLELLLHPWPETDP
jgi:hypothetical protein